METKKRALGEGSCSCSPLVKISARSDKIKDKWPVSRCDSVTQKLVLRKMKKSWGTVENCFAGFMDVIEIDEKHRFIHGTCG